MRSRPSLGRPIDRSVCELRPAGCRGLDRAGASRARSATATRRAPSPSRCCGPASSSVFTPICAPSSTRRGRPRVCPPRRGGCGSVEVVDTLRRSVTMEMDFRLEAAALSEMAENTKDDPDFRVPAVDWDRTSKEVLTLEWIDATPLSDRARLEAKGFDLRQLAPRADPELSAPRAARRLLSRRHASGQSVRRRRRPADRRRLRHHGSARRQGAAVSCRKSCTASSPAIITASPRSISRPATCRRIIRWTISPRRSAPSASRSTAAPPRKSRWRGC